MGSTARRPRFVLLGASNLARDLPALIAASRVAVGGPVEAIAAGGHGRSYGMWSQVMGVRSLPGIVESGLWPALEALSPVAPGAIYALVTDVGNDIPYGASAAQILGWVALCLERLSTIGARTVVVLPACEVVAGLPAWRFHLARTLLYPGRKLTFEDVCRRTQKIHAGLVELAACHAAQMLDLEPAWYGLDPVHPRRQGRDALRGRILDAWGLPVPSTGTRSSSLLGSLRLAWPPAHGARWLGREMRTPQPAFRWTDGSTLACY